MGLATTRKLWPKANAQLGRRKANPQDSPVRLLYWDARPCSNSP
jgi:hypothetical protein